MAIAHVVTTNKGAAGSNTTVTTDAVDTTGANLIVLAAHKDSGTGHTVSDSKGNTWTALTLRSSAGIRAQLYYCASPIVGSGHTFTLVSSGSPITPTLGVVAVSGAHASPFHSENGATTDADPGPSFQPGSVTPPEDGCLIVSGLGYFGSSASCGSGFTTNNVAQGSDNCGGAVARLIQSTAAAVNPTWTTNALYNGAATIAVFKPAAAAAAGTGLWFFTA